MSFLLRQLQYNMKQFIVLSKSKAKNFTSDVPWAAISIASHKDDLPKLNACQRMGLLQLEFADIEHDDGWPAHKDRLFTSKQAQQILEFAEQMWDKVDVFMVHCFAGVSRSAAVAAALEKIYNKREDVVEYWYKHSPNMLVFTTLLETAISKNICFI